MINYLRFDDVVRQVDRAGFVIRDPGLLASAIARPAASVFGSDAYPTVWLKAAALCQSIDNNQALVDGNKRLAWLATKVFLRINGHKLLADSEVAEEFMLGQVAGSGSVGEIADWLERHSTSAPAVELPAEPI